MITKVLSEFVGTAFLLLIVVGSGIMGDNLSQNNQAIALLANSLATGLGLFVLIQNLSSVSGAHFNPIVSTYEWINKRLHSKEFIWYLLAQFVGAIVGIWLAHTIFNLNIVQISTKERFGFHLWVSEVIASFGLICTIVLSGRNNKQFIPMSVAIYITSAYWFTSSTSFANPAVTIARMFTNTFCGISPISVFPFIVAQIIGLILAYITLGRLKT